jgi:hypothetical protein
MQALIVYESRYGIAHATASCIAIGLLAFDEVRVLPVREATNGLVESADLVVVGGPTYVHNIGLSTTRRLGRDAAMQEGSDLMVDPDAEGPGLREWFETLGDVGNVPAAAFDTRVDETARFTGRASRGIARRLRQHHFNLVAGPESFLVDKETNLLKRERVHARDWGVSLAAKVLPGLSRKEQPAIAN